VVLTDIARILDILLKHQKQLGVLWFNNHWLPAGMLDYGVGGSGYIGWATLCIEMATGTTVDSYSWADKRAYGLAGAFTWGKKRYFGIYVYFWTIGYQNVHIVTGACPETGPTNIYRHIGFKLIDANLYGTVGNGTDESTLLLETLAAPGRRRLECVLDPEVPECRFYLNGVDKGALTTNLPTGTGYAEVMFRASIHNTEAVNKRAYIYESRTLQLE